MAALQQMDYISGATLGKLKEKAEKLKTEIIDIMVDNIKDQNQPDSVAGVFSCLELSSDEPKEDRMEKLIHDMFGHTTVHTLTDKWNGYTLKVEYEARFNFTKAELLADFEKFYQRMNEMAAELEKEELITQVKHPFYSTSMI